MKITKTAEGKTAINMTEEEWLDMGKKAGWTEYPELFTESQAGPIKLVKQADGIGVKMDQARWRQIGKEAGWWDNMKQVGTGIGQAVKGVWNTGVGTVGLLGNFISGAHKAIQSLRENISPDVENGGVQPQELQQLQQLQSEINQAVQEANAALASG